MSVGAAVATPERRLSAAAVRDLRLVGLTFASGAMDAIAFLALGKVFTAFQTGNLVFAGIALADAGGPDLVRVACSIAAFAVGVYIATRLVASSKGSGAWPGRVTATLGLVVTAQAAFLVLWAATSGRPGAASGDVLVAMSALAMGMQSGAVLSLAVPGVFTTAATATVMFLARNTAGDGSQGTERSRLVGVLLALVAGAAASGLLLVHLREWAPVLPLAATALVVATAATRPR
jgi:uncharacterized membrane protein YoaK (UPF0700 family)